MKRIVTIIYLVSVAVFLQSCSTQDKATRGEHSRSNAEKSGKEELKGRDVVSLGKIQTIKGTLSREGNEWFVTMSGKTYQMHLGPEEYRSSKKFSLTVGKQATASGFLYKEHIAPCSLSSEGKTIPLRDNESGRPAWAGKGKSGSKEKITLK